MTPKKRFVALGVLSGPANFGQILIIFYVNMGYNVGATNEPALASIFVSLLLVN